jgi:TetR/AcrR family transcriptional regulator, cholesterol catabolism regulator
MTASAPPPSRTRRPRDGESRRDELLRIAARVFASKGIASATVRDIAQEAGILSGSLYHHFTSKEEMVKEIIGDGPSGSSHYESIIAAAPGPEAALHDCIIDAVAWCARHPDVARIFRNDAQYISETTALADTEKRRQSNRLIWIRVVKHGVADGVFRTDVDPDVAVRAMWDGVLASIRWFPPLGKSDPSYIGEQLAQFFLGGIRTVPERATRGRPRG